MDVSQSSEDTSKIVGATADRHTPNPLVLLDKGEGRPYIVLFDDSAYRELAFDTASSLSQKSRTILIQLPGITAKNWVTLAHRFGEILAELKVRQASYVSFGSAANLVENLVLTETKSVRTLVIVDGPSRPHPTVWDRLVDRIERVLPLGLPLRLGAAGFNVRAYLHRIRCPLLVVSTPAAGAFLTRDADVVAESAPTAWRVALSQSELDRGDLSNAIVSFQDTPAKCPQKNAK